MKEMIRRNINVSYEANEEKGEKWITGIIPYNSRSQNLNPFVDPPFFEIITPTAFNKTIADKQEVRQLFNHDTAKILGNTKSNTLVLENTPNALICKCKLPNTTAGNDAWELISRGDVTTMSFGFIPFDIETKGNIDYLLSVKLEEVSFCVTFPQYDETSSTPNIRQLCKRNNNDLEKINKILEEKKFKMSKDEINELKDLITSLNKLVTLIDKDDETETDAVKKKEEAEKKDTSEKKDTDDEEKKKLEEKEEEEKMRMLELMASLDFSDLEIIEVSE